jgi:hypothetical protein
MGDGHGTVPGKLGGPGLRGQAPVVLVVRNVAIMTAGRGRFYGKSGLLFGLNLSGRNLAHVPPGSAIVFYLQ